jgi:hypothetical protein
VQAVQVVSSVPAEPVASTAVGRWAWDVHRVGGIQETRDFNRNARLWMLRWRIRHAHAGFSIGIRSGRRCGGTLDLGWSVFFGPWIAAWSTWHGLGWLDDRCGHWWTISGLRLALRWPGRTGRRVRIAWIVFSLGDAGSRLDDGRLVTGGVRTSCGRFRETQKAWLRRQSLRHAGIAFHAFTKRLHLGGAADVFPAAIDLRAWYFFGEARRWRIGMIADGRSEHAQ